MTSNYSLSVTTNTTRYCDLDEFAKTYREFHGYFSIFVCVFGSVANILNVCVLTRREMRWPTNFILTGLAVADLLVMLDYIPYAIHSYLDPQSRVTASYFTYSWTVYMFFHALFAQVCHFISCCLTLILAVWRYIAISRPQMNIVWCNMERTKYAIILTYVMCTLICFPLFLSLTIHAKSMRVYNNGTLVPLKLRNLNSTDEATIYLLKYSEVPIYNTLSFWMYGVVIKLVPCILLTILSKQLIFALIAAQKRRYNLLSNKSVPLEDMNGKTTCHNKRLLEKEQQTDRTTRMLLAVLLLFLITEFPQAILVLLVAILGDDFDKQCHRPLGDLQDIFALTNSAINFILYCTMSAQFRTAFKKLFEPEICHRFFSKTYKSDDVAAKDVAAVTYV